MSEIFQIAIDGPSGAGKSTVAKALAKTVSYTHLDVYKRQGGNVRSIWLSD